VKGQGFVPVNATIDKTLNQKDPDFFDKMMELRMDKQYKILDTADYIIPPNEYNSIFIMTNYIQTVQTQGMCDEVNLYLFRTTQQLKQLPSSFKLILIRKSQSSKPYVKQTTIVKIWEHL
jgi:hypothetical protein